MVAVARRSKALQGVARRNLVGPRQQPWCGVMMEERRRVVVAWSEWEWIATRRREERGEQK